MMKKTLQSSRIIILNVNDDDANRYAIGRVLRRAEFEVVEAGIRCRGSAAGERASRPDRPRHSTAGHQRVRGLSTTQSGPRYFSYTHPISIGNSSGRLVHGGGIRR